MGGAYFSVTAVSRTTARPLRWTMEIDWRLVAEVAPPPVLVATTALTSATTFTPLPDRRTRFCTILPMFESYPPAWRAQPPICRRMVLAAVGMSGLVRRKASPPHNPPGRQPRHRGRRPRAPQRRLVPHRRG